MLGIALDTARRRHDKRLERADVVDLVAERGCVRSLCRQVELLRRLVDQNSASWNRITGWLRAIDSLRNAA